MAEVKEIWKTCIQNNNYAVSNIGRVKRITNGHANTYIGKVLKPGYNKKRGYYHVVLWPGNKTYRVHTLVLTAFDKSKPYKMGCNHKNGIKTDNRFENLEWTTQSQNLKHAFRLGLSKQTRKKLNLNNIYKIKEFLKDGTTQQKIADMFNVSQSIISKINLGKAHINIIQNLNLNQRGDI